MKSKRAIINEKLKKALSELVFLWLALYKHRRICLLKVFSSPKEITEETKENEKTNEESQTKIQIRETEYHLIIKIDEKEAIIQKLDKKLKNTSLVLYLIEEINREMRRSPFFPTNYNTLRDLVHFLFENINMTKREIVSLIINAFYKWDFESLRELCIFSTLQPRKRVVFYQLNFPFLIHSYNERFLDSLKDYYENIIAEKEEELSKIKKEINKYTLENRDEWFLEELKKEKEMIEKKIAKIRESYELELENSEKPIRKALVNLKLLIDEIIRNRYV